LLGRRVVDWNVVDLGAVGSVLAPQVHCGHRLEMTVSQQRVRTKLPVFRSNEHGGRKELRRRAWRIPKDSK
jgi:hypothetical protein